MMNVDEWDGGGGEGGLCMRHGHLGVVSPLCPEEFVPSQRRHRLSRCVDSLRVMRTRSIQTIKGNFALVWHGHRSIPRRLENGVPPTGKEKFTLMRKTSTQLGPLELLNDRILRIRRGHVSHLGSIRLNRKRFLSLDSGRQRNHVLRT